MKVTKTSVHRLTIEKTCGCQATREYEDVRYVKPIGEGVVTACLKHNKGAVAEFACEMLLEALDKEAETAGKNVIVARETATALSGTSGGSVTSMGAPNVPKSREKVDPLKPKTAHFDRPDMRRPTNTQYGNLNIANHDDLTDEELQEQGITMTGDIDGVPQDPRVDAALGEGLKDLENIFDDEDAKAGGVSQKLINIQAVD
jgi:hypothetical protein